MPSGRFIAFEGGEGAGKSTQAAALAAHLREQGREVVVTREPGGAPAAEAIREILLDHRFAGLSARAETLLFAAARAEHVERTIRPGLERGAVVITDRYLDSSIAYQGISRALGIDVVEEISLWATESLLPDLTIVLDVAPSVGLGRAGKPDRMEAEPLDFHLRVRQGFLDLAARQPERYLVIAADAERDDIARRVAAAVDVVVAGESV
ncbi:MAG: dTMP kinase [Actinobacteria bacterium]|uniref:dTMP kinase n=1 Tax=freshwater metagenome TaxID=449393 RepID=A0A6J7P518_9ZZZZ|nr:dTMP kinase [Actinomycetota bacterium]